MSCKVKLTKEIPTGLAKIEVDVISIGKFFLQFKIFYRYTDGFRPYLLDVTVNACEMVQQVKFVFNHPAVNRLVTGIKEVFPSLFTGCPYKVSFEFLSLGLPPRRRLITDLILIYP